MPKTPRALNVHFIATAMLVLAAGFITYQYAALPQEIKGLAGIVLSAVVFALAYLVLTLDAHKAELAKLNTSAAMAADNPRLEAAKAGMANAAQRIASAWSMVPVTGGRDNRTADAAGAHRMNLELAAMNALANQSLMALSDAKKMGAGIRDAIDALLHAGTATVAGCTCGPNGACSNCPRNLPATKATASAVLAGSGHATAGESAEAMSQQDKGNTAARITPEAVEANIAAEYSFTLDKALAGSPLVEGLDRVTLSVIVLRNGTKLVGVNYGAIDPARHDPEMGLKEARCAAIEQVWPLMGYELRSQLAQSQCVVQAYDAMTQR
jgi:hypothetical protein